MTSATVDDRKRGVLFGRGGKGSVIDNKPGVKLPVTDVAVVGTEKDSSSEQSDYSEINHPRFKMFYYMFGKF